MNDSAFLILFIAFTAMMSVIPFFLRCFKIPMVIDQNNVIVCGHTRFKAAKSLGLKEVPCIRANDLTDDQIKAFRLADNKVAEVATWDIDKLQIELDEISLDMSDFGFDEVEVDDINVENIKEDDVPEPPKIPKTKKGDIYRLGNHRLMCGDATSLDDVTRILGGGAG